MKNHGIKQFNSRRFVSAPLEYLSFEQMQDIHAGSLEVLEDCGSFVYHDEALDLLRQAGAHIKNGNRVYIPTSLVEQAIRSAPSRVVLYDRNGNRSMFLQGRNVYYGTGSDCLYLLDSFSGKRRQFSYKDVEDSIRLADALPNIDFIMCHGLAPDIDSKIEYQQKYLLMLQHSSKPQVVVCGGRQSLEEITEMAACVMGGHDVLARKPMFCLYTEPSSPLTHNTEALDKLLFMAEHRLPINYSPGVMAGGNGPVTVAGAITQANAEILAGLVIHQLKEPGSPFVFGAGMSPMDMGSMQPTYAAPEAMMAQAGLCQLTRSLYDVPTWGFGGCSSSKLADEQAMNEASMYILMSGLMGTNLVHDVGYLEFGVTYSYTLLVMCDEVIGQVRRMMGGIQVDRESMALDAIERVGPGGHFLTDDHTVTHFRENWFPGITDRQIHDKWKAKGGTRMGERAKEVVKEILESYRPQPLPEEKSRALENTFHRIKARHQ